MLMHARRRKLGGAMARQISVTGAACGYVRGWIAALDEMRRPDWRDVHDRTRRDIAAGRGRELDEIARELGLEEPAGRGPRGHRTGGRG